MSFSLFQRVRRDYPLPVLFNGHLQNLPTHFLHLPVLVVVVPLANAVLDCPHSPAAEIRTSRRHLQICTRLLPILDAV